MSKGRASNLVMTESAFFASAAQRDCFNDLDVERYEVVATLDSHTSQTCRDMDGHVFDMKDYEVGATAPPFHGRCRSVTAPWFDDNYIEERAARGADGKTYYVPGNMKYEDWYEVFVEQSSDMADWKAAHLISTVAESTFTPAKTIPEADKFARDQGVENVSFKGIDIDIANSANQSLYEHFTEFPELKENIHFWGSAQEKKKFLGDAVKEYYENAYAKYRGAYPDAYLDKRIKSKATSYFRTSGEWAHAFDHRKHFENEMFSGIAVNSNQVKNVSRFMELLKRDVGSRFHPVGCDTVKSIFDHEFGHQLDYLLGISKNPKFVKWMTYGIESGEKIITNNLSKYAMKNRKEVIAEAWAEYRNNPEPRPVAKAIGELIESEYKRKFGK